MLTKMSLSPSSLASLASLASLLVGALLGCSTPAATPPAEPVAAAVPMAAPALGQDLVGVISTRRSAVVAAEFEARVQRILVTSGQRVKTGDPLAQLDDSQLRQRVEAAHHAVEAAHAKVLSAGAQVANAQRKLIIEQTLYKRGAQAREAVTSARFELSSAAAAASAAKAEHQAATASRVELEQQLAKATLVAPMDGLVAVVKVKEGEIARSGTKIARVFDPQDLRVQFELPRALRDEIAIGSTVEVIIDGATLRAPVIEISADLEPPLQFAIATADIVDDASSHLARVGAEVRVKLTIGAKAPVAAAPAAPAPTQVAATPVAPAAAPVAAVPVPAAAPAPVAPPAVPLAPPPPTAAL